MPTGFVRNVTGAFANGAEWLDNLPTLLATYLEKWNLSQDGSPFDLSFHYVVPVLREGKYSAVLKLGVPAPEFASEAEALRLFHGHGAVAVLESDPTRGALLLERIRPGNTLASSHDEIHAAEIAAQTMRKLWQANPGRTNLRSLDSWTAGLASLRARFDGATGPLAPELVDLAENLRAELLQEKQPPCLLHADLHHFNILYGGESGWVAIDPKGVVGDPSYEPASFLLNPNAEVVLNPSTQQDRIAIFAQHLNLDPQRITRWAFVHAVLSAWWTIEDGGHDYTTAMSAARLLLNLLG
ncbi:MAG TPA: aminoglycoside phosphotransferase family protein [Acidobacteriaceae bacterium]|nr:aminoglycoside phosphotransferase family protein [Acidobacteriaceae bacterium]